MSQDLTGKTIAFLVAGEGIEQAELTGPWEAVQEAGGTPQLLSPRSGQVQAFRHLDRADTFPVDVTVADADVTAYDGLVLPGGVANPDALRTDATAVRLRQGLLRRGRAGGGDLPRPWTLVEADVLRGRRMTSWPSLQTDLRNAGADWVDEQVVVDTSSGSTLVTSRNPDDLTAFCQAAVEAFAG